MKDETDFKQAFCDAVTRLGGFTFKIAMPVMPGLPDLYCVVPGYIPVLLEAKYIRDVPEIGKFKRKIPYRPLQQHYLKEAHKVVPGSSWCLLCLDHGDKKVFGFIHPNISEITHAWTIDPDGCFPVNDTMSYIKELFELCVPRVGKLMCEKST